MAFDPFGVSAFTCCGFLAFFAYRLWQENVERTAECQDLYRRVFELEQDARKAKE